MHAGIVFKMNKKKTIGIISLSLLLLLITACGNAGEPGIVPETETQQAVPPELVLDNFLTEDGVLNITELQRWNPACCGWLSIEDTDMSFPVMYAEAGDTQYSNHDFF